jgi:hypothetical protein
MNRFQPDSTKVLFKCIAAISLISLFGSLPLFAQETTGSTSWQQWNFLLGDWVGEGGGSPGRRGTGTFSFVPALQNTILIRTNHSDFPATNNNPAYVHDDLMIIYSKADTLQAIYFDNEKHVFHYLVEFTKDTNSVTFLSDVIPAAPRFKLTYNKVSEDSVKLSFDIAPPGKPAAFFKYLEATARKKK